MKLLPLLLLLSGCFNWVQTHDIKSVQTTYIETDQAPMICGGILGGAESGCAIRLRNTSTNEWRCAVIILPGDSFTKAHEDKHCLGWDHP